MLKSIIEDLRNDLCRLKINKRAHGSSVVAELETHFYGIAYLYTDVKELCEILSNYTLIAQCLRYTKHCAIRVRKLSRTDSICQMVVESVCLVTFFRRRGVFSYSQMRFNLTIL